MTTPVTFALIGAGNIAQSYVQAFENHPEATLVAIVDTNHQAARKLGNLAGCAAFGSYEQLLQDGPQTEAVVVCTPPNTHEEISTAFIRRGRHVLCEKPFTLTSSSARLMAAEAQAAGVILTMASKFRYVADVITAKAIVTAGTIGEVILFENAFASRVDMTRRWNSVPQISGGGVLIDNGTHSVDLMRYFLGPLVEVNCVEGKRVQSLAVEDTVRVFVRSVAGVMGSVDLSWSLNKELDWYLNIYGSRGTIQVGWKQSRYKQEGGDWIVFGTGYQKTQAFRSQLSNFARAIRGLEPLVISIEDAIASVDVIEAAYRSLRAAPWIGVTTRRMEELTRMTILARVGLNPESTRA
jgi:predicted dehydrogenase